MTWYSKLDPEGLGYFDTDEEFARRNNMVSAALGKALPFKGEIRVGSGAGRKGAPKGRTQVTERNTLLDALERMETELRIIVRHREEDGTPLDDEEREAVTDLNRLLTNLSKLIGDSVED